MEPAADRYSHGPGSLGPLEGGQEQPLPGRQVPRGRGTATVRGREAPLRPGAQARPGPGAGGLGDGQAPGRMVAGEDRREAEGQSAGGPRGPDVEPRDGLPLAVRRGRAVRRAVQIPLVETETAVREEGQEAENGHD